MLGRTNSVIRYRKEPPKIYGAKWEYSATSTVWERTDDAKNFADPVPYVAGATNYGSPFDNILPWSGMVKEERTGGTMVAIPKFYYKLTQLENGGLWVQIATGKVKGYVASPAHMDRGDGNGERDVVYIGRYHCSTSHKSVTGKLPTVNEMRVTARRGIHDIGANFWLRDRAMTFTIWLLYIVEFANWNSQAKIGYGCGDGSGVQTMGYTDSMPYHTGTTQSSRTTYGCGTQYRNIEGLWDNCYDWEDGGYNDSNGYNVILNPANFSNDSNGISVGTPVNGYSSKFEVVIIAGLFPMFIPSESSGSSVKGSCDYWLTNASNPCVYVGGSNYRDTQVGMLFTSCNLTSYRSASIGSRIMELP